MMDVGVAACVSHCVSQRPSDRVCDVTMTDVGVAAGVPEVRQHAVYRCDQPEPDDHRVLPPENHTGHAHPGGHTHVYGNPW